MEPRRRLTSIKIQRKPCFLRLSNRGADIVSVGISGLLSYMGPEVREAVKLFESDTLPPVGEPP